MFEHPTGNNPETVTIVACGQTSETFHRMHQVYEPSIPTPDETWSLNKSLRYERADLFFILDDLVGEAHRSTRYQNEIMQLSKPVITSIIDAEVRDYYDSTELHEFPYSEICHYIGFRHLKARGPMETNAAEMQSYGLQVGSYMHNSIPAILLYALYIGVKRINLFGADYTFNGNAIREADRANAEYCVGLLRGFGVDVWVSADTSLLNTDKQPFVYGYGARQPIYSDITETEFADMITRYQVFTNQGDDNG